MLTFTTAIIGRFRSPIAGNPPANKGAALPTGSLPQGDSAHLILDN